MADVVPTLVVEVKNWDELNDVAWFIMQEFGGK